MAVTVRHAFVSPVADRGNPDEVGPDEWNAEHVLEGLPPPLVILATGQSNVSQTPALGWSPDEGAMVWEWPGLGSTGTQFVALPSDEINSSYRAASEIAARTGRSVYLINIGSSGRAIAQWMEGAAAPDMYADCKNNVEAALTALGLDRIDLLIWWQGESDAASPSSYVANFETVMTRFKAETWFPADTPVFIHGISSAAISGNSIYGAFNNYLQLCAGADPERRWYSYTPGIVPASLWSDTLHLTAEGHDLLGYVTAAQVLGGPARDVTRIIYDPETGRMAFGGVVPTTALFEFVRNGDFNNVLLVSNSDTGSSAIASLRAVSANGTLSATASGAGALANSGVVSWSGSSALILQASAATGQVRFISGGSTERMRIASDGAVTHRANATTVIDANSHLGLRSYTVATLPSAATAGRLIYVSDGTSNKRLAVSDGTNWRWPDGAVVS